jgi:hypothetical protein
MSGLERLVAGEATDFERQLLGAWDRRQPSAEARSRVLAVAGVGLGAAVLTSAAGATAAKAAGTSIAPKAVLGWSAVLMKWLAVGFVGATATAGAVAYVHQTSRLAAGPTESTPTQLAPVARPAAPVAASTADPQRTIELGPDTVPVAKAKAPSVRSSTLDDEVSIIDQARRAVTSGEAAEALQIVGSYDAKYPGGALSQESTEIRIEALIAQGNRPVAERLATKFIASHPSSPYVHRIRALLGDPKGP